MILNIKYHLLRKNAAADLSHFQPARIELAESVNPGSVEHYRLLRIQTDPLENFMPNPEKRYTRIALVIMIAAAVLVFLPGWIGLDGMDGGFALSFVFVWIAISAALVALFFRRRAAQLDLILKGQDVLAHWTYTPAEWEAYYSMELDEQLRENRALWYLMAGMSFFIGGIFWLIDREAGQYVLLMMVALTLVLAAAAFGLPRLRRRRREGRPGEVWMAPTAVFFDGEYATWDSWETGLDKVEWRDAAGSDPACLVFHLSHLVRTGIQVQELRIPVPGRNLQEARDIIRKFKTKTG